MRRTVIYITLLLGIFLYSCGKDTVSEKQAEFFVKFYANQMLDEGSDVCLTANGGYAILGTTETSDNETDAMLVITDSYGNYLNSPHFFGGPLADEGRKILSLSDGSFLLLATVTDTTHSGDNDVNILLTKIDANGDSLWTSHLGDSATTEVAYSMLVDGNGNILLAGYQSSSDKNALLMKTDANGKLLWQRTYGTAQSEEANSIAVSSDGYVFCGYSEALQEGTKSLFVVKTDTSGIATSSIYVNGSGSLTGVCIQQNTEGKFVCLGSDLNATTSTYKSVLYILSSDLATTESKFTLSDGENLSPVMFITEGTTYTVVANQIVSESDNDVVLLRIGSDGSNLSTTTFGANGLQTASAFLQTADGGYAIAGTNQVESNKLMMLIKTRYDGSME
jgi:hypothetical protein